MKLSTIDRLIIIKSLLPSSGSVKELKKIREIRNKISFSEEEYSKFRITEPYKNVMQIDDVTEGMKVRNIDYNLTVDEIELLKKYASIQDNNGWVTEHSLDTIELFINYSTEETLKQN